MRPQTFETRTFETKSPHLLLLMLGLALCAGCDQSLENLPKYPVNGTVLLNGKPAPGILVTICPTGAAAGTFERPAAGVTDADGYFELSTIDSGDGALAGEYAVTFMWLESSEFPPRDRFGGAFSDVKASQFQVTVTTTENVLDPFELEFGSK